MRAIMLHAENSAVGYYRVLQQAKYLNHLGWDAWVQEDEPEWRTIDAWEKIAKGTDIMVCARSDTPDVVALALGIRDLTGCKLVYEIDDNVYDVARSSTAYEYWYPGSPFFEVTELFLTQVDAITVSTPNLAEVYRKFNDNIYVLRNCQDPETWEGVTVTKESHAPIVIGWAGGTTHYDDLHMIRKPLKKLLRNYPNVILRLAGLWPDFLKDVPQVELSKQIVHFRQWPQGLANLGFDIGLAPVVDRPFNRGKSNIKWQEYSMLEIPTVASKVGEYNTIRHGETGFLADSEAGWYYYLEKLVKNALLRQSMGQAAKAQVLSDFNIQTNIGQWDAAYRQIISNTRK